MSLSATKPRALNTIMMGISCLMYGRMAMIRCPIADFLMLCPPLAIMLTQRVEVGREECSRQDRISALKANFPSFILKTYTVLVAIFSWAISTFSEPLIMKYPPGSSGHSFSSVRSRSVSPFSRQYVDLNMIGIFPIKVF